MILHLSSKFQPVRPCGLAVHKRTDRQTNQQTNKQTNKQTITCFISIDIAAQTAVLSDQYNSIFQVLFQETQFCATYAIEEWWGMYLQPEHLHIYFKGFYIA